MDRTVRHRIVAPPDRLATESAAVIGVGCVGRQVALQLAQMGVQTLYLVDPDDVGVENLAPQGYREDDIGASKVDAVIAACRANNSNVDYRGCKERWNRNIPAVQARALFVCVDSIDVRRFIWEQRQYYRNYQFMADGRMTAEVFRVISGTELDLEDFYESTLFSAEEAFRPTGSCATQATGYCGSACAAVMVQQYTKWLRYFPVDPSDVIVNLLAMEMNYPQEVQRLIA